VPESSRVSHLRLDYMLHIQPEREECRRSADFAVLLPLRPQLLDRTRESQQQSQALSTARQHTTSLLVQYNEYVSSLRLPQAPLRGRSLTSETSALSELFLDIHRRLEDMEESVSRAERKKRRELAERY
jgi:protein subunit release factor B